ncbi:beta-N-acetylhexosaminidase [Flavobacterium ammonificans]|jgi:hexosaminidase|uniref:beta-N-acetylhexosaminidase n=1 Tax=Flavobacterium ammonificans TaxID=1751056 RepID=UPI001E2ECDBD|nr:family 20 glycosylhydrolase [Flavobacterium ammonificans]BDB56186.1 beta-hexosaminidase [Flavobacterium ammonificans]
MKVKFTSALIFLISCFAQAQHTIIPNPVSYIVEKGSFVITPTTKVVLENSNPELLQVAELYFGSLMGKGLEVVQKKPTKSSKTINVVLNPISDDSIGKEGYSLKVNPNIIVLKANSVAGIFYGLQTLDQLLNFNAVSKENIAISACTITDYPRFGWRGLMLDVSRHFFSTSDVKKYIDWMSKYKFNVLHWHLSDDNGWRIEIKSLPKLTEIGAWRVERFGTFGNREAPSEGEATTYGGFYTQEEIKDILQYAAERQITVVPEIDIPGHSMALLAAYPELSTLKEPKMVNPGSNFADWHGDGTFTMKIENSLNPSDEKVYTILDTIFGEVAALFPGQYIHIGGDECYHGFWEKDPNCIALMQKENLKDAKELQSYFIKKVVNIITSKGKKAIGWDEILYGGLADGAAIMSWRGTKGGIEASKAGHEVVMSPNSFAYLDYTQGDPSVEVPVYAKLSLKKSYEFEPAPEGVDPKYILGGQGNLWTEKIPTIEHAFYMTYPRALAIIESVWSPSENKEWNNFSTRLETHFNRFETAGKLISKAVYDPIVSVKKQDGKMMCTLSNDLSNVDIYYTIDGTFPAQYSTKYTQPFEIPKGDITFRAVSYRNGKSIGRTLTISKEMLEKRIGK